MAGSLEEVKLERLRTLRGLQRRATQIRHGVTAYYNDPVAFAHDCIDWGPDNDGLTVYQEDILNILQQNKREAVRGPHGLGKSTVAAVTILWFSLTRDAAGVDWKAVTTAGAWRQLINYLWPEIRKWANRMRWEKVRERPFSRAELLNLNLRLNNGAAQAAACSNPALIEGAHADSLLFIYDESKAIPPETFDACEGAFSGTGESLVLALSTPGPPQGRFYDIHARKDGYLDWAVRHVTLDEAMQANRISPEWAEARAVQWGRESALFQNRVLGEFYAGEEDSIIPLSWVEAAVERWHEWVSAGRPDPGLPHTVGVDVAYTGTDKTVLALRRGDVVTELRSYTRADTMETTGHVVGILNADDKTTAIVDVVGVGAGVYDRLREQGHRVQAFNAAARTKRKDSTGELGYLNVRAAAWGNMRDLLDPSAGATAALPDDDELLGDLTAPKAIEIMSGGKIKIESKDDIRKRIGRSTDKADAVVEAFYTVSGSWTSAYGTRTCERCKRGFLTHVEGVARVSCPHCRAPITDDEEEE